MKSTVRFTILHGCKYIMLICNIIQNNNIKKPAVRLPTHGCVCDTVSVFGFRRIVSRVYEILLQRDDLRRTGIQIEFAHIGGDLLR